MIQFLQNIVRALVFFNDTCVNVIKGSTGDCTPLCPCVYNNACLYEDSPSYARFCTKTSKPTSTVGITASPAERTQSTVEKTIHLLKKTYTPTKKNAHETQIYANEKPAKES
ncbi:hypothetical protein F8M41_011046 [Gigaspora margarita]|uniref:Uncharacterized protein n=1 Tax=Gigaspora margarita TaxID=4874 RepID=A0A8H3WZQ5_GIGMA|nr:hypothetical protein F8M41_011046 [Gigaspora margarita]